MTTLTADAIALFEHLHRHTTTPGPDHAVTVNALGAVLASERERLDLALSALDDAGLIRIHGAASTSASIVTLTDATRPPPRQ